MRSLGIEWTRLVSGGDVAAAASVFGETATAVAFDSGRCTPSDVRLRGEILSRRQWSGTAPLRFCPACLANDALQLSRRVPAAWHRTWWDVPAIDTCPIHHVRLASGCACGEPISRSTPFDGFCPVCRRPLREVSADPLPGGIALAGTLYVAGRLGATTRTACRVLDRAPLRDAIDAMSAVGKAVGDRHRTGSQIDSGFRAFAMWPRSFDRMLDGLAAQSGSRAGRWGAAKAYGSLYAWAAGREHDPLARRMAGPMASHADRNGISPGRTLYGTKCGGGPTNSLAEVSRRTGFSYARSRRLVTGCQGTLRVGSGAPASIDARSVQALERAICGSVDLKSISALMGVSRKSVRELVRTGTLVPVVTGGVGGARHAIQPKDAADLVYALQGALDARDGPVARLPDACRGMQVSLADAIGLVLRGKVRGRALGDGVGLAGIGVVQADLRDARRNGPMTLAAAARALGVKWEVARNLVAAGLLSPDGDGRIGAASVGEFRDTYVSAAEVAAAMRTSPRGLLARARDMAIAPVVERPACRQAFFRRSEIERLLAGCRP